MESDKGDSFVPLKKRGDKFYKEGLFGEALKIYNSAIKKDGSNLELLLCRAETYNKMEQYSSCVDDLLTITEECDPFLMSRIAGLMSQSNIRGLPDEPENCKKMVEIYRRAIGAPSESARFIEVVKKSMESYQTDTSSSVNAIHQGCINYYTSGSAIKEFTKAIEYDSSNSLAFAYRAVCFAEEADREQELISDIQKSIDLDYRNAHYLTLKAREFEISLKFVPCFRLIRALGASIETYKRSAGKLFPALLDDKKLNDSDRRRYNHLVESLATPAMRLKIQSIDSDYSNREEAAGENKRKLSGQALSLKEKGDQFYEEEQFKAALKCYNKAIKLDKFNLELLICRVQVYFDMEKWARCISEANKLVALHKSEHKICKCMPVFRAWKLIGLSVMNQAGPSSVALEAFTKALRIDVPANEINVMITLHNMTRNGAERLPDSNALFESGRRHAQRGNSVEAIKEYTKAIKDNQVDAIIYAFRALCYAEDDQYEQELISDVKKSLDLDYRVLNLLLLAGISSIRYQPTGRLRLLKALSLCEETFKQSAGRIFPKILDNKPLDKYERIRCKELADSWNALIRLDNPVTISSNEERYFNMTPRFLWFPSFLTNFGSYLLSRIRFSNN